MSFLYKKNFLLIISLKLLLGCGTIYIPQVLPEARGVSLSEGQEKMEIEVIPVTIKSIKKANEDDYERRVVEAGDLSKAAKLISIKDAINEKLPPPGEIPGSYLLGTGDVLTISTIVGRESDRNITNEIEERQISISDNGFSKILGLGDEQVNLGGKTQIEAENEIRTKLQNRGILIPEFELFISKFNSQKIYVTNNLNSGDAGKSNVFQFPYTNTPLYLNQILSLSKLSLRSGEDAIIILKRKKKKFRISAKKVVEGVYTRIRLFPEDQIIIEPIPYRPETAIIMGEIIKPRLYSLSPSERKTLSEALYSDTTFNLLTSDTSQIYLLRPRAKNFVSAYHLDASNPSRLILATKLELRPNDIIYVAPQPVTSYNRALIQIFGAYALTQNPSLVASQDIE